MGLFGFGKKKNTEAQTSACACQCGCSTAEAHPTQPAAASTDVHTGTLSIKVLGTGCASCHTLLENTKAAVSSLALDTDVVYITDLAQIAGYGVMQMPALVVNEKPVVMGKVLKPEEVADILRNSLVGTK